MSRSRSKDEESPVSPQTSTSRYKSPVQSPPERPRAPYSYTTENLQSVIKQNNQTNVLERSRNIYNFNSEELYGIRQTPNLYPNLNVSRGDDSFVYVNDYGQTRSPPQPSAPPASVLNDIPTLPTTLNASKRPSTPQTPQVTSRNSSTPQSTEGAIRSALQEAARHPLSQANVSPPQASQLSQRQPFSQDNVVHKVAVSNASPMVPPRPPPINTSQTRVWTSQSINASPNKNGTLSDDKHNAPRPSESNSSANKKGPKTGARDRDNISCPTCGQRYGLAIFQCGNGHGSCQECRSAVKPCGKCLSPITAMRNIAMEAVIADLITACPTTVACCALISMGWSVTSKSARLARWTVQWVPFLDNAQLDAKLLTWLDISTYATRSNA
ncbi:histone-lysine N-methyltransferase, H3 lysine-9 specific-like [Leguminivora glycinivorella]|uniref:histone-lysine N-methyltransferase, H3 lysine-9 specific-like n=1 Tax=Leguminivora glycinivorella TaxID=1035111 RepID=UPI00200BBB3D|nr:histone-lysine N-methyltransferase, H3 lysine-9 specific-like [Leguminivora glycinivorella]XP_047999692.1 histone-lysine N-methyltransferase, H3 lysine-9 specific-like [Leguminivora glycinivorella]